MTAIAAVFMICYHAFITSTFPLAVPLEWNVMFMYITAFLFLGFPNNEGFGVGDMDPVLLVITVGRPALLPDPRRAAPAPRLLPAVAAPVLRQLGESMWAFAPGAEAKLDEHLVKPAHRCRRCS